MQSDSLVAAATRVNDINYPTENRRIVDKESSGLRSYLAKAVGIKSIAGRTVQAL